MTIKRDPMDDILDRPIAFNPAFKRITGSTVAALMLSQAWYWTKRTNDPDGWFYKTRVDWEDETGLTRYEQETARKVLCEKDIMVEHLRGVPATLHYKVNKSHVYDLLGVQFVGLQQTRLQQDSKLDCCDTTDYIKKTETTTEITADRRPNIFTIYEQNIGPLTSMLGDQLKDIDTAYPKEWFADAVAVAVENNKRNLGYILAILRRWKAEGKDSGRKNGKPTDATALRWQAIKVLAGTPYTEEDIEATIKMLKGAA